MTYITKIPTKKAFKEVVKAEPNNVWLEDPSIYDPMSGYVSDLLKEMPYDGVTVTNHPKRSWFARVYINNDKIVVE